MTATLATVDYVIIGIYVAFAISVGLAFARRASRSAEGFFVGDKKLPWWIAGTSIVATTFAADTPLAVTGLVAKGGVSANWLWWSWAVAHVVATFYFARLWRRSGVITDAELTELRYNGRAAAALRGFKAVYFGIFINCLTMAWVIAAMVKIAQAFFVVDSTIVIVLCILASVTYTTLGGFRGVVITDVVQFTMGMGGAVIVAILVVKEMGGIGTAPTETSAGTGLVGKLDLAMEASGSNLDHALAFLPPDDHPMISLAFLLVLISVGWWRLAEGSGYIVQRLAACKDEANAQAASLWFAVAHNALRPWPWIIVGLASLIVYPALPGASSKALTKGDISVSPGTIDVVKGGTLTFKGEVENCKVSFGSRALGEVSEDKTLELGPQSETAVAPLFVHCGGERTELGALRIELVDREMGYPLLLGKTLPAGLLGLVIASLLAAFMSTIDTHTNWGASYLVQDLYRRFFNTSASERHYVWVSRVCIVLMALLAGAFALVISNIAEVWVFLITLGAGLGSVTAARWFWARVTPQAEFAALGITTVTALVLQLFFTAKLFGGENVLYSGIEVPAWGRILIVAAASLMVWIPVAAFGPKNDDETLRAFGERVQPPGASFARYGAPGTSLLAPLGLVAVGAAIVYGALFGIGELIFGNAIVGGVLVVGALGGLVILARRK